MLYVSVSKVTSLLTRTELLELSLQLYPYLSIPYHLKETESNSIRFFFKKKKQIFGIRLGSNGLDSLSQIRFN